MDLIKHINQVENLLENTGKYYLIIPDKRYCFDYFIPECSVADVPGAALLRSSERHHPANILKHRAMITHNDPVQHWSGLHGDIDYNQNLKLTNALTEIRNNDGYIDVHAWQFTPESFKLIVTTQVGASRLQQFFE